MKLHKHTNRDVTRLRKAKLCAHPAICVGTLSNVYDPNSGSWMKSKNATGNELISQIAKCSSAELSIKWDKIQRE